MLRMVPLPRLVEYDESSEPACESGETSKTSSVVELKVLPEGFIEEKFRIDRKKLEAMILGCPQDPWDTEMLKIPIGSDGRVMSADEFFTTIMAITNTEIKYPKFLKIGARNQKDPHVSITGRAEDVADASLRIRYELQQCNRITMKMDISWTAHSHIIGKKGRTIQSVARKTGVSIHFPDMNKNSMEHKSNQVSVNARGDDICGLELCRAQLRALMPLTFTFRLPPSAQLLRKSLDPALLVLVKQQMHSTYWVQVDLDTDIDGYLLGSVKGTEWDYERVMDATLFILRQFCGDLCNQIPVELAMEVSEQQQNFVLGKWREHLRSIMQKTATTISLPDIIEESPHRRRSTVIIFGSVRNVYQAKQHLTGCLPLVLLFEIVPEQTVDQNDLERISRHLDIYVMLKDLKADGRRPIVLKTSEKNASNLYEAWRLITKSTANPPTVEIPTFYKHESIPVYEYNHKSILPPCLSSRRVPIEYKPYTRSSIDSTEVRECPSDSNVSDDLPEFIAKLELDSSNTMSFEKLISSMDRRAPGCEKRAAEISNLFSASDYFSKRAQAADAMKSEITQTLRVPNSEWSGFGFSKSMPGPVLEQLKRQEQSDATYNVFNEWVSPPSSYYSSTEDFKSPRGSTYVSPSSSFDADTTGFPIYANQFSLPSNQINLSASSYIDSIPRRQTGLISKNKQPLNIGSVLKELQMEQYIDVFANNDVDLERLLFLTEPDLKLMGVTSFGHRRTLMCGIQYLRSLNQDSPWTSTV